jgi:hypothetical protein
LAFTAFILGCGITYYFIARAGYGLHCLFSDIFHIDCPFCGLTRMCVAIIELRFKDAFYFNMSAFMLLPVCIGLYLKYGYVYVMSGKISNTDFDNKLLLLLAIIMIVNGVVRNIIL